MADNVSRYNYITLNFHDEQEEMMRTLHNLKYLKKDWDSLKYNFKNNFHLYYILSLVIPITLFFLKSKIDIKIGKNIPYKTYST